MAKITHISGRARKFIEAAAASGAVVGKVGWFPEASYNTTSGSIPVAAVAARNEYGDAAKGLPPRPFFRPTVAGRQQAWRHVAAIGAKGVLNGTMDQRGAMELLALQAEGDVMKTLSELTDPALAESTIYARQHRKDPNTSEKPLNDRGRMFATLTHQVEEV